MSAQPDVVDDARASAQQWVEWVHELVADRPALREAIERCLRTLVLDARRRKLQAHLDRLDATDLDTVSALIQQLQRHPRKEDVICDP